MSQSASSAAQPSVSPNAHATGRRGDTKSRIIDVALRLFNEQGYDKTSLREIADEIGVTKAALYYHFRTKDDLVRDALEGYTNALTALVDEIEKTPPGSVRVDAVVDGLLDLFSTTGGDALRFARSNPTAMSQFHVGEIQMAQMKRLVGILAGPERSAEAALRALLAFGGLAVSAVGAEEINVPGTVGERREAARKVALDLLRPGH